jgi:hypothetical protein
MRAAPTGPRPAMTISTGSSSIPVRVVFLPGFSRCYTGVVREFEVEAKNCAGSSRRWTSSILAWATTSKEETTVAIDGALYKTAYFQPLRPRSEVFFIPKLEGG